VHPRGTFVDANGVHSYVEQRGSGDTVLLLHGGLETIEMLPQLTAALAERYHVIAPERRGHGRTADVPGPITYATMAEDTLALLDALGIARVHLVGYSDGANIAMLLAIAHPERVARLVLVSGNFHADGMTPEFRLELRQATAETFEPGCAEAYGAFSPDGPEHWPVVFEKVRHMWLEEPTLTVGDLAAITASTLVLAGEDDYVSTGHTVALAEAIAGARRRLVPGGSHGLLAEQPTLTTHLILEFLAALADAL
jgi:pimeloyl-ACP methyl ester carboxylesterase